MNAAALNVYGAYPPRRPPEERRARHAIRATTLQIPRYPEYEGSSDALFANPSDFAGRKSNVAT